MTEYIKHYDITEPELWPAIGQYVTHIETGETKDTCKCEWGEEYTGPTGIPMKSVIAENLECPVHTKEGFLLGFFRWMFPDGSVQPTMPATLIEYGKGENGHPDPDLTDVLKARIEKSEFRTEGGMQGWWRDAPRD